MDGNGPTAQTLPTLRMPQAQVAHTQTSQTQDHTSMTVTFTQPGSLGVKLQYVQGQGMELLAVSPDTQAMSHPQLYAGLMLTSVGGQSVVDASYEQAWGTIRSAGRPIELEFRGKADSSSDKITPRAAPAFILDSTHTISSSTQPLGSSFHLGLQMFNQTAVGSHPTTPAQNMQEPSGKQHASGHVQQDDPQQKTPHSANPPAPRLVTPRSVEVDELPAPADIRDRVDSYLLSPGAPKRDEARQMPEEL